MTPPDYDDLCAKLRELYVQHGTNYVQAAANAIESLREQVAEQSKAADMIAEERDAWEKRAKQLEADNAALRQDAERYRFLRDSELGPWATLRGKNGAQAIDAAIDAALLAGKKP